jgi:hypothetical protein
LARCASSVALTLAAGCTPTEVTSSGAVPVPTPDEISPVAMFVDILPSGAMRVDGKAASGDEAVFTEARLARAENENIASIVIADPTIAHHRTLEIMRIITRAGIRRVSSALLRDTGSPAAARRADAWSTASRQDVAPTPDGNSIWKCYLPREADKKGVDSADVVLRVMVGANGEPHDVHVLEDPGFGYGRAAAVCALLQSYRPGTDETGIMVRGITPPITVRFRR